MKPVDNTPTIMPDHMTIHGWVNSISEVDLDLLLHGYKTPCAPPLQHPWPSPALRQFIAESPDRIVRRDELLAEPELQHSHQRCSQNYPPLTRICELLAEWEDICRLSKLILSLQDRSLPKLEESERSSRIRLVEKIRLAEAPIQNVKEVEQASVHHLSLYGEAIKDRCATPAPVSYWAARSFAAGVRNMLLNGSRHRVADRVRASEGAKWLDTVALMQSTINIDGQGSALCQRVEGHVEVSYLPQGSWKTGEALEQGDHMQLTSKGPWLNPRVVPYVITMQDNDMHVNDDGRWHGPFLSKKRNTDRTEKARKTEKTRKTKKYGYSPLHQELKPEDVQAAFGELELNENSRHNENWGVKPNQKENVGVHHDKDEMDENTEEFMESYEYQTQIGGETPSELSSQLKEVKTMVINRLKVMEQYLTLCQGQLAAERPVREEEKDPESEWEDGPSARMGSETRR